MKSKKAFSLIIILVLTALTSTAWADSYHYRNLIVGDRASGMGGSYTAIADDPSGIYYNPAGLVYTQGTNVSASANAYHNSTKKYSNVLGGEGWERNASTLLPNFFGVVQKMGKGRLGLAYVVPDTTIEDQDQTFEDISISGVPVDKFTLNFNNEDSTHLFGIAYAREINESFSWGLSLFYHHRRIQRIFNQLIEVTAGNVTDGSNSYYESEEDGVRPVIGLMWVPADKFSFGASISKTFLTGSRTSAQLYDISSGTTTTSNTGEKRKYPLNLNIGGAYFASETFLISADINYYTEEKDNDALLDYEKAWITNFALGTEYYFSPTLAMRFGLYSNLSAAPDIVQGVNSVTEDKVDLYGGTLSFSHFGRGSSLTYGLAYATGSGDAQVTEDNTEIQTVDVSSWTIYLSNSYGF